MFDNRFENAYLLTEKLTGFFTIDEKLGKKNVENCNDHSDSRECVEDYVAAYRAAKMREKHAAEGSPHPPNFYDTTGWAKPIHPVYTCVFLCTYIHVCVYTHT